LFSADYGSCRKKKNEMQKEKEKTEKGLRENDRSKEEEKVRN
jgi:hypothetical protein